MSNLADVLTTNLVCACAHARVRTHARIDILLTLDTLDTLDQSYILSTFSGPTLWEWSNVSLDQLLFPREFVSEFVGELLSSFRETREHPHPNSLWGALFVIDPRAFGTHSRE